MLVSGKLYLMNWIKLIFKMKVIAVIPARKGSLRLPNKNRKKIIGKVIN